MTFQNILIASLSPITVRLGDFGIAKFLDEPHLIDDDSGMGSREWAAPEQLNYTGVYDTEVDMWSVGCVVYYMLTSMSPFSNEDASHSPAVLAKYQYAFWPRVLRQDFQRTADRPPGHEITIRGVSTAATLFLRRLIIRAPKARMSALEALSHLWINPTGIRPVGLALIRGNMPLAKLYSPAPSPSYMLRVGAANGHLEIVRKALSLCEHIGTAVFEADVADEMQGPPTDRALVCAAANGNIEIVRLLFSELHYRNTTERETIRAWAVSRALHAGHSAIAADLWASLTDFSRTSSTQLNVQIARFAIPDFLKEVVGYLHGQMILCAPPSDPEGALCSISALENNKSNMFYAAARAGNACNVDILLSCVYGNLFPPSALYQPLESASAGGHLELVRLLSDRLLSLEVAEVGRQPPPIFANALATAVKYGHMEVVQYFLMRGVMPDLGALSNAVEFQRTALFSLLVNTLRRNHYYSNAYLWSFLDNSAIPFCDESLLAAHPFPTSLVHSLAFHVGSAARVGNIIAVNWLLNTGSLPSDMDVVQAGLLGAAEKGYGDIVSHLCARSNSLDVTLALGKAAAEGHLDVVEVLLEERVTRSAVEAALVAASAAGHVGVELKLQVHIYRMGIVS